MTGNALARPAFEAHGVGVLTHSGHYRADPEGLSRSKRYRLYAATALATELHFKKVPPEEGIMKVQDVMTKTVAFCHPDANLAAVVALMWEHNCGQLPGGQR